MSEIVPTTSTEDTMSFVDPEIGSATTEEEVISFIEKLDSLESSSTEKTLVQLVQLCSKLDYPIELMRYRPDSIRANITIPEYDYTVVVKHQRASSHEARLLAKLQPYRKEVNFPVSYSSSNWSVMEFIDGEVSPYDRTSFALFAIEHLSRLQTLDLTNLQLNSFVLRHNGPLAKNSLSKISDRMLTCGLLEDHIDTLSYILQQMQDNNETLFKELLSPKKEDFVLSHGDYALSNIIFPHSDPITECYIIDWERAGIRPRWYDIASFVHVCALRSEMLEELYWAHYKCSMQDTIYDPVEEDRIFLQYRVLASLVCAISQHVVEGNTEFSRSVLSLEYLFPKLVSATGG